MLLFFSKEPYRTLSCESQYENFHQTQVHNDFSDPLSSIHTGSQITGYPQMFRILIVDPNDPFRRSLKKVLVNRFPFVDIQQASDGTKGLEMVQGFGPNLIFLEIHLPSESGLDLARQIKIDHPEIIIVMLTSYNLPEYRAAALESGVAHLVPKDDWTGEDMIALLDTILTDLNVKDQSFQDRHQLQRLSS